MNGYHYLSNPYNGTISEMNLRAHMAAQACGQLLKLGIHVWSPIVHNHAMMTAVPFSLEERRAKILEFDFSLLRGAKGMIVLELEGWEKSFGVKAEIDLCNQLSIPVQYLDPKDLEGKQAIHSLLRALPRTTMGT